MVCFVLSYLFNDRERILEPREEAKKNVKENSHGIQLSVNKNTEKRIPLGLHKSIQGNYISGAYVKLYVPF
jgi:hypothetical protein